MRPKAIAMIVGSGFALFGLTFTVLGTNLLLLAYDSSSWPHVQGTVSESSVKARRRTGGGQRRQSQSTTTYTPDITYTYTVAGQPYLSSRVDFVTESSKDRRVAEQVSQQYPVGQAVRVYYKPTDPFEAVLHPGVKGSTYAPLVAGFIAIGVSGVVFLIVLKQNQV